MIYYKLVAVIISILTGDTIGEYEEVRKPMTMEKCLAVQQQKAAQHPVNGTIIVFECRQVEVV